MTFKKQKFSWEKVKLVRMELQILNLLCEEKEGSTQKHLSQRLGASISAISKGLNKLLKKGLTYCIEHPIKIYKLIPERVNEVKRIISGWEFGKNGVIIDAHYFVYETEINELPEKFLKRLVEYENWIEFLPNFWKGYKITYLDGSVKFHKTDKGCKALFYFKTFARDHYIADMINNEKFFHKKLFLENKYPGLKIGNFFCVARCPWQEVALLKDPLSVKAIRFGIKHKNIEDSHRIGGEWEEKGPNAIERIRKIIKFREIIIKLTNESIEKLNKYALKFAEENK
jgi:hypothetical protein